MNKKENNKMTLYSLIFSTKSLVGKALISSAPLYYFLQTPPNIDVWTKIANISIALFVVAVGIYVLWKEYKSETDYSKQQTDTIIELAKKTAVLAENSTKATENSTKAIENMTRTLDKFSNRIDGLEDKLRP